MLADGAYMVCSSEYFNGLVTETKYNRGREDGKGIHFFKTREEAENFLV